LNEERSFTAEEYKKIAKNITDLVWSMLDKEELSPEEADRLIHASYAARFHWGEFGEPLDIAHAEWHLARANLKVGRPVPAFYHSQKCLEVCRDGEIGPLMIAYAYEASARCAKVFGDEEAHEEFIRHATTYGKKIKDKKEKETFFTDLALVPGFEE